MSYDYVIAFFVGMELRGHFIELVLLFPCMWVPVTKLGVRLDRQAPLPTESSQQPLVTVSSVLSLALLGIEPRTLCIEGKCSVTEPLPL